MKRFLTLCLLLALLTPALAESYAVSYPGSESLPSCGLLLDEDGTPLTGRNQYDSIYALLPEDTPNDQQLYAAYREDIPEGLTEEEYYSSDGYEYQHTVVLNARGEVVSDRDATWYNYDEEMNVLYFVLADGRVGAVDTNGALLIPALYGELAANGRGGYLALEAGDYDRWDYDARRILYYIDPQGRPFDTGMRVPYGLSGFHSGLCLLNGTPDGAIYLDWEGTPQFGRAFDYADDFHGNYAIVSDGGDYGLIDRQGRDATPMMYDSISYQSVQGRGIFAAESVDPCGLTLYDARTGETLLSEQFPAADHVSCWAYDESLLWVWAYDNNYNKLESRCYNGDGRLRFSYDNDVDIESTYVDSQGAPQRMAVSGGDWPHSQSYLIDLNGSVIGGPWQSLTLYCWRDGHGRYVFYTYDIIPGDEYGDYVNWNTQRVGVVDENGNVLLDAKYTDITVLGLDRYWVHLGDRWGMIDGAEHWYYAISDYEGLMD